MWKLKCCHVVSLGNTPYPHDKPLLNDEDESLLGRSGGGSGHGCPLYDWFHQGSPKGATPSPTHTLTRFPSRHFSVVTGLIWKKRVSHQKYCVPLPRNSFVNVSHKCQQLMIYVIAAVQCTCQHVGSDYFFFTWKMLLFNFICFDVFTLTPGNDFCISGVRDSCFLPQLWLQKLLLSASDPQTH